MIEQPPADVYRRRLARLQSRLREAELPAMWITNPINRRYLSGFTGTSGAVLVTWDEAWLFTDFRYMQQAPLQVQVMPVVEHKPQMLDTLHEWLRQRGIQRLGFEAKTMTYGEFLAATSKLVDLEWRPTVHLVEQLRLFKDEAELKVIRRATQLADDAFAYILNHIRPGVSERELALKLEWYMRESGATSASFDIIVASGERSALPHGIASDKRLHTGEFVKLDFGALLDGYCSDLTRTVMLGQPTARHREIYQIVLAAQQQVLLHLKPGMTGKEADALARQVIADAGYGDQFGHGTGHGFGMDIHEDPRLNKQSTTILQPGMTVTVEPGIYVPEFGGVRIEDDVLITADGIDILTTSPKSFIIID